MRKWGIFTVVLLSLSLVVVGWGVSGSSSSKADREIKLKQALAYLNEIPEIEWVKFEDNTVRIGVNKLPRDINIIASAAALHGNKAINFGVHVWVHPANNPGIYYGEVTARYGKVTDPYGK